MGPIELTRTRRVSRAVPGTVDVPFALRPGGPVVGFEVVMPPNMRILARGIAVVLGLVVGVSGVTGLLTGNPMIALNGVGFIGICALSAAVVFFSTAIERVGLTAARQAAVTLVAVLAAAALLMTILFVVLILQARFRAEASGFGLHSAAGILVLAVLGVVLALTWRDR